MHNMWKRNVDFTRGIAGIASAALYTILGRNVH